MSRKLSQRELENLVLQEMKTKTSGVQKWGTAAGLALSGFTLMTAGVGTAAAGATGGLLAPLAGIAVGLGFLGATGAFVTVTVDRHLRNNLIKQMKINGEEIDEEGLVNMVDATIQASISDCEDKGQEVDERKLAQFVLQYLDTCFENLPNKVKNNVLFEEIKIKAAGGSPTAKAMAKRIVIRVLTEKDMLQPDNAAEEFNRASEATFDTVTDPSFMDKVKGWFSGDSKKNSEEQLAASHYRRGIVMSESALRRVIRESIKDAFSQRDPDFEWQDGFTDRHYSADTMFAKDWSGNIELLRKEILPQLSHGAQVLDKWNSRSNRSGDVQIFVPNPDPEDMEVLWSYGFQEAHRMDISRRYKDQAGKLFVRTASSRDNYGSYMD